MKVFKLILFLALTGALIYILSVPLSLDGNSIPPLGKFLNPYSGFWQNAEEDPMNIPSDLNLKGLKESVTIVYDSNYVPHIYAQNNEDLFFAQGYVMAQNRLWQMEFQIMAAAGRLSEILGYREQILSYDRMQRRKGMTFGAKRSMEKMREDPELLKYAEAFSEGVNAYIENLSYADLPIEYKLLNYKPEPWSLYKSALILESMIDDLTGRDEDLENTNALILFGKDTFDLLYPERIPGISPTVPSDNEWDFDPVTVPDSVAGFPMVETYEVISKPDKSNGSNNWAISPQKSATGNAILASDPHLGLNLPSLWMMIHLNSPEYNVYGFTFPGAIGVTMGFNDSISWGFTNAPRDTRDWYKISFTDESKTEYVYDGKFRNTERVVEEIKIKGQDSYYDTVIYTHHGPIVYDENFTGALENLALKWGGHEPSLVQKALLMLNRAGNYEEYKNALVYWQQPPQNAVFASVQGDIALTVAGKFPLKWPGQGKFIMEGSDPRQEWQGYIPMEHNAFQLNPERGFVSSANQHSVDEAYPYWFYNATNEFYRNRRINRVLDEMDSITVEDIKSLQNDNYSIKAEEILPLLMDTINLDALTNKERQILENLQKWDYVYDAVQVNPVYFNEWWETLHDMLWDEMDSDVVLRQPEHSATIHLIKSGQIGSFTDILDQPGMDSLQDVVTLSFKKATKKVQDWGKESGNDLNWGNYKNTTITHLTRSIKSFSRENVPVSGHGHAINATKPNHGPSFRMVVEMSSPPQAWGIYPGGQSGNPGSQAYDNMIDEWSKGAYRELLFPGTEEKAREISIKIQTLKPKE